MEGCRAGVPQVAVQGRWRRGLLGVGAVGEKAREEERSTMEGSGVRDMGIGRVKDMGGGDEDGMSPHSVAAGAAGGWLASLRPVDERLSSSVLLAII